MPPPPPYPERIFDRMLSGMGLYGKPKNGEYGIFRKENDELVGTYAVSHGPGKPREVKHIYYKNLLKSLERLQAVKEASTEDDTRAEADESWMNEEWYRIQQAQLAKWSQPGEDR